MTTALTSERLAVIRANLQEHSEWFAADEYWVGFSNGCRFALELLAEEMPGGDQ